MSYDESDYQREVAEQALEEMFREWLPDALWERSAEVAARYLQTFGDEPYQRVLQALADAEQLAANSHDEAALTRAFTAIELMIGYLLFRPLFMGVLLSEELANRIVSEIINGKGDRERSLLPSILRHWKIDLDSLALPGKERLWATIIDPLRRKRNAVVHEGARASAEEAARALTCAKLLLDQVVRPLATELGFTLDETGKFSEIRWYTYTKTFATRSPFKGP